MITALEPLPVDSEGGTMAWGRAGSLDEPPPTRGPRRLDAGLARNPPRAAPPNEVGCRGDCTRGRFADQRSERDSRAGGSLEAGTWRPCGTFVLRGRLFLLVALANRPLGGNDLGLP